MYLSAGITLVTVVLPLGLHLHPPHVAGQAVQHLLLIDEGHHSLGADDLTPDHSEDLGNDGLQRDVCLSVHVHVQYYEGSGLGFIRQLLQTGCIDYDFISPCTTVCTL